MTTPTHRAVDVDAVRAAHPIEEVVARSGVDLIRRGHGYMACCPFHDDSTASLSVGGIPDRFHCFGCGASGDVIDYVRRLEGITFLEAVHVLEAGSAFPNGRSVPSARPSAPAPAHRPVTPASRVYEVNNLAWAYFTRDQHVQHVETYLRDERGIDVTDLREVTGGAPVVGYAPKVWQGLTSHLRHLGVT